MYTGQKHQSLHGVPLRINWDNVREHVSGVERDKQINCSRTSQQSPASFGLCASRRVRVQGAYLLHTCFVLGLFIKYWENNFLLFIDTRLVFPASLIVIVMGQGIRRDADSLWWKNSGDRFIFLLFMPSDWLSVREEGPVRARDWRGWTLSIWIP